METRRQVEWHGDTPWGIAHYLYFSSVQLLSHVPFFATPWIAARKTSLSITNSQSLLKLMSIELVMPSNHLILCHPLLLPSFPASGSFPMNQLFASGDQSFGASASTSVLPMNTQDWFPLGLTGWILQSKGLSRVFSNTTVQKHQFFGAQLSLWSNSHIHIWKNHSFGKTRLELENHSLDYMDLCQQSNVSLLFNMLSRFVIAFFPRSKHLLISWLQSPAAVILEPKKMTSLIVSIVSPSICHEVKGLDAMILVFGMLSFKPAFSLSSFTFIRRIFSSFLLSAVRVVLSAYLRLIYLFLNTLFIWLH